MKYGLPAFGVVAAVLLTAAMLFRAGWTHPPVHSTQNGYRGLGMEQIANPEAEALLKMANALPDPIDKASPDGDKATAVYKNVQVLNDLSADQFNRVMLSITEWVAPQQGCGYCHNVENLADDGLYTKIVARRMLQMTRHINVDWKAHVAGIGVTCYTCHRGAPVPANIWYQPNIPHTGGFASPNNGMGHPGKSNGDTGLPLDSFAPVLAPKDAIRVVGTQALPKTGMGASIQTTEQTYALMIQMSESLGVNCTFCHNTRAFSQWPESTPQRLTAWHGIQMVRELNASYLDPLKATFPPNRLGPVGDGPKVDCATCHQGVSKPMLGVSLAKDYPELGGVPASP
jgi:photosynthetic reaction center cytochrome c subunit